MQVVIIGAGGHGKVVLDILRATGRLKPAGFIDADPALAGQVVAGLTVLGPPNLLPRLRQQRVTQVIVAIGDNRTRLRYIDLAREHGFELASALHPTAFVSPSATLGANVVVAPHASVITEARVGDGTIVNTAAVVDHECVVGEGVHVGPAAVLAGRVRVGRGAFVGMGAKVIQCRAVGEFATVGAGAVVIEDVPDGATAVGVPARVVKSAALVPAPAEGERGRN